ncbi:tyrosine-type recombinase/integrase [Barrientosiimonas endolithica]|uniref:Integrase n=1 Tax=Barrientosiimonas endolithica TaxID=1535208 RepID=A0ABM8HAA5_9MICO|nr:tyrosine-type recombinase/integrase [Barrientosiimonas endolithica]BDZ57860.1 hypothetical protein GCM10025872_15170 [Barrientosiimonas endolithica]
MAAELQALAASFARHLRAEGKAARTIVLYGQSVRFFADWLAVNGQPATLEQLTRRNLTDWLADLQAERSPGTVKTRYRGMSRFCRWLVDEDEVEVHPMKGISPPTLRPTPVPVLTDDELAALLAACKGKTFENRRDEVLIRLLLDCGLRVSELCGIEAEQVDLDGGMVIVTGKGSKVRPVYFGARTTQALDRYLRIRSGHRWASSPTLLLSQRGPLTPDGVRERMKVLGARAGVDDLHPHRFRHTFAHDFLKSGGQERDLKRLAGWTSDVMLERYGASAADERARAAAKRLSRGDRV